jgi:hypothetical protein
MAWAFDHTEARRFLLLPLESRKSAQFVFLLHIKLYSLQYDRKPERATHSTKRKQGTPKASI